MKLFRQLRALFRRSAQEVAMAEEIEAHLEELTARYRAEGLSETEARQAARREFGGVDQVQEACRDAWGLRIVQDLRSDFQFGWRQLRKAPGFATIAVLTLAIGIGATTAIFSIINNVVLQPLPYVEPERLVSLHGTTVRVPKSNGMARFAFHELEAGTSSFESIGACGFWQGVITGTETPLRFYGMQFTSGMLPTLGVEPLLGRSFRDEEHVEGNNRVVILSHRLWRSHFQQRPDVLGETVRINDEPWTIVGVMPASFLPRPIVDPVIYSPAFGSYRANQGDSGYYNLVARLKPRVSLERAAQDLAQVATGVVAKAPQRFEGWSAGLEPLIDKEVGAVRPMLWMLLGAVGFLLVIACVNVANLLLTRATLRGKEIAVRAALGAGRGRIVRQLLAESLLLSGMGMVIGVGVAFLALEVLVLLAPLSMPRVQSIAIDGWALGFCSLLALFTGLAFGGVPALQASKVNLVEAMNAGARGSSAGGRGRRLRGGLVVLEFTLALALLMAAGLLLHSFVEMEREPLGYEAEGAHISRIFLPERSYPDDESRIRFVDTTLKELSAVPGVETVTFANRFPAYIRSRLRVTIPGRPEMAAGDIPLTSFFVGTPDYFGALGIPLERGRLFDMRDALEAPWVAVVSRGFADHYFPGEDPVGQLIKARGETGPSRMIVGVVGTIRDWGPLEETPLQIYVPYAQFPFANPNLLVRSRRDFATLEPELRRALDRVDPRVPLSFNGMDLQDFTNELVATQRYSLLLFGVFSVVALLLCALGIYGMVAFSVSQRIKEVGIRMALGAQVPDILRLIMGDAGRQVLWGLGLGLVVSFFATRYLSSLLYKVSAHDPLTYVAVPLVLLTVAFVACWLPARRATRVDPSETLRAE